MAIRIDPSETRAELISDTVPATAPIAADPFRTESPQLPLSARPAGQAERSLQLALAAADVARENRGEEIRVLDLREVTPEFDYFVIVTGKSRRQLHAISEEIDHRLEDTLGDSRRSIEGYDESRWILLDYGSVVVHLFDDETRGYYALEDLWNDALVTEIPSESSSG
ncbi:ribosome silencing factor [Botrimarina hoheduenensis]|uniref:Ribosomal silencing factor RsfS n=1 Tax=Botrimarina hoheduenensis TaxID=2528000 RepID=A0A5C5WAT2_9BACT|nr:ribosome silencing factor [Botrimarina hoheduenensis]TWT47790.1 Ribosomal silencing factor RsfS [Botrimarina hoheduenensis]